MCVCVCVCVCVCLCDLFRLLLADVGATQHGGFDGGEDLQLSADGGDTLTHLQIGMGKRNTHTHTGKRNTHTHTHTHTGKIM